MQIIQDIIAKGRANRPGRSNPMKYVTIHNTGNSGKGATAKSHAAYVKNADVSWHYTVDESAIYQHLPDNEDAFHCGDGSGTGNRQSIGIEVCMNSDGDLKKATDKAAELTAHLCKLHNIPAVNVVQHNRWSGKNCPQMIRAGKPYDWAAFIGKVKAFLGGTSSEVAQVVSNERCIWDCLTAKGLNHFAAAGLMGNLFAESGLDPKNLQNAFESKFRHSDESYTAEVDKGLYPGFANDGAGYGIAQWTYWSRKQGLLDFAKAAGKSVGNLGVQLDFLWKELQGYAGLMAVLRSAKSVREASDAVLTQFERPADMGESVKIKRAGFGQGYYDKFAKFEPYKVRVNADALNFRAGAGTNFAVKGAITDGGLYTIVEEANGSGAKKWGKLMSGAGWISLDYTERQ